jgi:hypothetical protein
MPVIIYDSEQQKQARRDMIHFHDLNFLINYFHGLFCLAFVVEFAHELSLRKSDFENAVFGLVPFVDEVYFAHDEFGLPNNLLRLINVYTILLTIFDGHNFEQVDDDVSLETFA